ncbi:MAG: hypothetical protein JSV91_09865 [Phycisphaerales bacterium]|nr:MAG: hypothetical protein JSV91_09865 [Phycisphaerales bacterium]
MMDALLDLLVSVAALAFCSLPLLLTALLVLIFVFWKDRWRWVTLFCLVPPVVAVAIAGVRIAAGALYPVSHGLFPIELAVHAALWCPVSLLVLGAIWLLRLYLRAPERRRLPRIRMETGGNRSMKRRVLTILLFLLMGAVVNVALAWGCVVWSQADTDHLDFRPAGVEQLIESGLGRSIEGTGDTLYSYTEIPYIWQGSGFGLQRTRAWLWGFEGIPSITDVNPVFPCLIERTIAGWPQLCLRGERINENYECLYGSKKPAQWRYVHSFVSPRAHSESVRTRSGLVPILPLWRPFLLNTIFYAVILWLLIRGPFVLRLHLCRRIRMKRGRCLKCGYDLRGDYDSGCPECGWNRGGAPA